ncbi:sulfite exporter TauE/SafE family protein [Desulfoluna sp.]|uniref:sulfite exporter TauE/SafE family protein n=1 Tax=Desulfoluna sp. TaxID=2045199 RepID=UPI002611901A|nr:sulfite exporter TauE/SafE family protein [Desulfoluna sp.]
MQKSNRFLYVCLFTILILWLIVFPLFQKEFLEQFYYMPFLGVIAATVANTTPAAAGIVYFPVLTRLDITPATAVQFSLIIQAYGMGLGTFKWYHVNKKLFIANVIPLCLFGGILGIITSIVIVPIKNPELLTLIFNAIGFIFTQIIFFSILRKRHYPNLTIHLTPLNSIILFTCSLIGGLISGWIGFGIDTLFYFILTFLFRINPAVAIVTSISLMAALSAVGTLLNVVYFTVPLSLWYSAVPGVTLAGLFLASYFAVKIGAKNILLLFAFLMSADFFMALWTQNTIPMSQTIRMLLTYVLVTYLLIIHVKIFKLSYQDIDTENASFKEVESVPPTKKVA